MIGENAGGTCRHLLFVSFFLEAPRGLRRVSARRPTREPGRRAAHGLSMMPAYESSRCGAGRRSVVRHQARRGNWRSHGDRLTPERASRAPRPPTPGHRPLREPHQCSTKCSLAAHTRRPRPCAPASPSGWLPLRRAWASGRSPALVYFSMRWVMWSATALGSSSQGMWPAPSMSRSSPRGSRPRVRFHVCVEPTGSRVP